jgi:hypothetical protein
LSLSDIDNEDISQELLNSFAQLATSGYGSSEVSGFEAEGFDTVSSVELAEPPSEATTGQSNIPVGERISYSLSTVDFFVRTLISDEQTRFIIAAAVTTVIIPLIVNDPDISSYEDIVTRVYWALLLLYYVISDEQTSG